MQIKIALENGLEGKSVAWVLDHPGCFTYGKDESEAIVRVPQTLLIYQEWIAQHTQNSWLADLADFDVRLVEVFECYFIDKEFNPATHGHEINAWFRNDWKPLTRIEIDRGLQLLEWTRQDLLELVSDLTPEQMDQTFPDERWSIRGILQHVASAENWYMNRLALSGRKINPPSENVFEQLTQVRAQLQLVLPALESSTEVRGVEGEFWSGRKLLRRAVWHEKDHYQHILRLMTLL